MKNHHARAVEIVPAISAPIIPPTHALKKTAGKKKNHAKGFTAHQNKFSITNAIKGKITASNGGSILLFRKSSKMLFSYLSLLSYPYKI
ncbi:MAG: hypothetical protein A2Y33_08905 [Spirochaetes bacterium GWF1_51_8]|nr:MAG: hypothetical protein A2Y33_08905 [Spirochaetes bacterium GWF1_51_8]